MKKIHIEENDKPLTKEQVKILTKPSITKTAKVSCIFENIILVLNDYEPKCLYWENIEIIKTALKTLEIIKEKKVNINNFLYHITKDTDYKEYKRLSDIFRITIFSNQVLTQEEYDLLKKVLL